MEQVQGERADLRLLPTLTDAAFEYFEQWASAQGMALYPAQEEAILEIMCDAHVIVSTPTGSGKSLIALSAHAWALAQGKRSFYTAPIKALVSEKFFALVDVFGAEQVGLLTGDSAVNPHAPIICCTAEILAQIALREGGQSEIQQVVMDEFHYYADPDRGWAWQVPLLAMPDAQFILMSATLGDTKWLRDDLTGRSGRPVSEILGVERPVPLSFRYSRETTHEVVEELLHSHQAPIYLVHFSQRDAVDRAQALSSIKLVDRQQRDKIREFLGDFRFSAGFGKTLANYLKAGIGVHHAGMLPRYRRLVEQCAQAGLLRVISGTDTLGVGINVPIRTVLLTGLTKFDGTKMRQLQVREFQQIAGRAGRAGFDTAGYVVVQAPEHEIENAKALKKAGDDPKKRRKIVRKKIAPGQVTWGEGSMERLIAGTPEPLSSQFRVTYAMMLQIISRGGDAWNVMRTLIDESHEPPERIREHQRTALRMYRTLHTAGLVRHERKASGALVFELTEAVQPDFALNQPLAPFALAALELFDPNDPDYTLDVISTMEAVLEDPHAVLRAQERLARTEKLAQLKAEGMEYDERMEQLEEVTHPQPLAELLTHAYEAYAREQPWVLDHMLSPKTVVRDMYERAMSFSEYVSFYSLARVEGVLLRYLTDAYRTCTQTVPENFQSVEYRDLMEWLGAVVRQIDSSLLDEWEELRTGTPRETAGSEVEVRPAGPPTLLQQPRALRTMIRNALFHRVQLAARRDTAALGELDQASGWTQERWGAALDEYAQHYVDIGIDTTARSDAYVIIPPIPQEQNEPWRVEQIFADPEDHRDWSVVAEVDLAMLRNEDEVRLVVVQVGERE